jgi:two-component system cell cycle response regulator DivK
MSGMVVRRKCVLIVEDHAATRDGLREYLTAAGFVVHECGDGADAQQVVHSAMPHLVVLDMELPGIDGWEVARRLKADEGTKHIPLIALTGHHMPQEQASALRAGCDVYLAKPCPPDRLLEQIHKILSP